ncbi:hypothetical protein MHYP_G00277050 [Metynnis hypsauchen]
MDSFFREKGQRVGGPAEFTVIDESHFRHKLKCGRVELAKHGGGRHGWLESWEFAVKLTDQFYGLWIIKTGSSSPAVTVSGSELLRAAVAVSKSCVCERDRVQIPAWCKRRMLSDEAWAQVSAGVLTVISEDLPLCPNHLHLDAISTAFVVEGGGGKEIKMAAAGNNEFKLFGPRGREERQFGSVVTLSFHLSPEISAVAMEIRWFKGTDCVCLYKNRQVTEGRGYEGRVSLFTQELQRGNVSLQIRDCRESDEGDYLCQVTNGDTTEECTGVAEVDIKQLQNIEFQGFYVQQSNREWTEEERKKMKESLLLTEIKEEAKHYKDKESILMERKSQLMEKDKQIQEKEQQIKHTDLQYESLTEAVVGSLKEE